MPEVVTVPRRHVCTHCKAPLPSPLFCGACKSACYCGRDCQRAHWKAGHQALCTGNNKP